MWGRLPIFWWVPSSCCVFMPLANFVSSPQKPLPRDPSLWMLVWRFFLITSTWYMWSIWFYNAYFFPAYIRIQKKHIGKILEHSTYDHALQHIIKNIYHISTYHISMSKKKHKNIHPSLLAMLGQSRTWKFLTNFISEIRQGCHGDVHGLHLLRLSLQLLCGDGHPSLHSGLGETSWGSSKLYLIDWTMGFIVDLW